MQSQEFNHYSIDTHETIVTSTDTENFHSDKLSECVTKLREDGFAIFPNFFDKDTVSSLNDRLEVRKCKQVCQTSTLFLSFNVMFRNF